MASFGFEIAATWKTSAAMHFGIEDIIQDVVPPSAAEGDPAAAEVRGKKVVEYATAARGRYDKEHQQ